MIHQVSQSPGVTPKTVSTIININDQWLGVPVLIQFEDESLFELCLLRLLQLLSFLHLIPNLDYSLRRRSDSRFLVAVHMMIKIISRVYEH